MTSFERITRSTLGTLEPLAEGGQAKVYRADALQLPGEPGPFAFKEYRDKNISISGLDRLEAFRRRLPDSDRAMLDVLANWPLRVVEMAGGLADGLVLPLIPPSFFFELTRPDGTVKEIPRNGEFLTAPKVRCDNARVEFAGLGDRYRFCRDLSLAVGFLHRREICLGDISFGNLTYSLTEDPTVYLVDCDAFRLRGQAPVVPQLHTPDWIPPEGSRVQSAATDRYKLGLFVLRVLSPRAQSAQNRDPAWADGVLDANGRQLLRRAVGADPPARTMAKEWYSYFKQALASRPLAVTASHSRISAVPAVAGGAS
jgi:hypothetical protein